MTNNNTPMEEHNYLYAHSCYIGDNKCSEKNNFLRMRFLKTGSSTASSCVVPISVIKVDFGLFFYFRWSFFENSSKKKIITLEKVPT